MGELLTHIEFADPNHDFPLLPITYKTLVCVVMRCRDCRMDALGECGEKGDNYRNLVVDLYMMDVVLRMRKLQVVLLLVKNSYTMTMHQCSEMVI